jgi:dihydrofolate synthase / folylpolyglutamate synthase
MDFAEAIDYLYSRLPFFQNQGARAYKPGLTTTRAFCKQLGDPHTKFRSVHVGGTNGKGSTSHMLAAVLQAAGYKVGLYTSPHLKSFTERIRINGAPIPEEKVASFVARHKNFIEHIQPSFFEVTVAMAFDYFAESQVDIAIVEVGMGGRLDSTNVISPLLSIITNISYDHMQYLGNTLPEIAGEKAGIIKSFTPVIISEKQEKEIVEVFEKVAHENHSKLYIAEELIEFTGNYDETDYQILNFKALDSDNTSTYTLDLRGGYQYKNCRSVLIAIEVLRTQGFLLPEIAVQEGLRHVVALTGLKGRWQQLSVAPLIVCDTAHNWAGLSQTIPQFMAIPSRVYRFVLGFVADKDINRILTLFPKEAVYYFCQPSNQRAFNASLLSQQAKSMGLIGECIPDVNEALKRAIAEASAEDSIYVGGSTFVVADLQQI